MSITVNPDSLAADGAALADWRTGESPPGCEPASAHSVSIAVAAQLSAHSASLTALINHGQQVRAEGGAATLHTAASLRVADEAGARVIAGKASTSEAVSAPMSPATVPAPLLPDIPAMPPPPTIPGEAQAIALHTGPGAGSLRDLAEHWRVRAATLDNLAAETSQTSASIDAHWSDGGQRAGANTAAHGIWWSDMAGHARALATAASEVADQHDRAVAMTPTPQEFADAHTRLALAKADNVASRGLRSGEVSAAAAQLAQLQSQAAEAAGGYYTTLTSITGPIAGTPEPAPPIATGGPAEPGIQSGAGSDKKTGPEGSATPAPDPGVVAGTDAGTALGGGAGPPQQMAGVLLPAAQLLPMGAMGAMSALSGLAGLSPSNVPATASRFAAQTDEAALDPGVSDDLGDTSPAAAGGGGAEAVGGLTPTAPVAGPSPSSPNAVSGPVVSVGTAADGAATAPAGAAGGSGMATYPPMMGAPGAGDAGGQRNVRLFPDRRLVWRPVPNTEAVFGELQRERRSRVKRPAPQEGTDEG